MILDEKGTIIKMRRAALLGGDISSDELSDSTVELTAAVDFKQRGVETKLMLPGLECEFAGGHQARSAGADHHEMR